MYIGNIVSKDKIKKANIFNIVDNIEKVDNRFPTLIVGWETVKNLFPETSILDWKITDDIFWTHSKHVKRTNHENDIKRFKELCVKRIGSYVTYQSFCLFTASMDQFNRMLNSFQTGERKYCFVDKNEIYVYYPSQRKVLGISETEYQYLGIDKSVFTNCIAKNGNKVIYNEFDIPWELKELTQYRKYLIPFLLEISENQ